MSTTRERIAAVAQAMLDGTMNMHEGCREITILHHELEHELRRPHLDDPDLRTIVGIDSELDYPVGPARQHWAPAALAEKDRERDEYLTRVRDHLFEACRALASWR